jgi:hypothetical protein
VNVSKSLYMIIVLVLCTQLYACLMVLSRSLCQLDVYVVCEKKYLYWCNSCIINAHTDTDFAQYDRATRLEPVTYEGSSTGIGRETRCFLALLLGEKCQSRKVQHLLFEVADRCAPKM